VQNNPLYQGVTINHSAVDEWPDDFVPSDLQQEIVFLGESDHHERAGYTADLQENNYENDWQAAEDDPDHPTGLSTPVTGSVLTDITENARTLIFVYSTRYTLLSMNSRLKPNTAYRGAPEELPM
jgi:hypothetical protein